MGKWKKTDKKTLAVCAAAGLAVMTALLFCFSMIHTINMRMNESATTNLLNTTEIIVDALEGNLSKDMEALNIVGEFYKNEEYIEFDEIRVFCDTLGFDWITIVDDQGRGADCFEGDLLAADIPGCSQWTPEEKGYSDVYIGQSGRPQITFWMPVYDGQKYVATVFGGVILNKYYSASVFTFYDGEGRTYVFDGSDGSWIIKSLGTDGASLRQGDIYSLLLASGNTEKEVDEFRQAIETRKSGTAVFLFNNERSYLCFTPLPSSQDWYLTTVIARDELLKESSEVQRMIQWVFAIFCVTLAASTVSFALWRIRRNRTKEVNYREALFANISSNLDSAFLIYEKKNRRTAFVSDNVKRLLGLRQEWLREDAGHLFDWCNIEKDDPLRKAFLEGTLEQPAVREVCVENELGVKSRYIRLEIIPADLDQEIAVLNDITDDKDIQRSLEEAMQQAKAASRAKDEFLSSMSHDIRTPLNGVIGMTAIAVSHLNDRTRVRDCLTKISEASAHLLHLINEVLDMSRIESGKMELSNEPFNLAKLLQESLGINYPGLQQKNQKIHVHIHLMEHEEVIGDPVQFKRIMTNLLSNAIKYTPSGGVITMSLREKPSEFQGYGCYEMVVQDNGIGMSQDFQKRLFMPFEREEDVRISRIQGTGLGMSIVKNIVTLMMGDIQVESEKGKGSTFRVTVHLRLDRQNTVQNGQLASLPVLVVDDDAVTCETVSEMLCDIGMIGEWADNGRQAVRKVVERHENGTDYVAVLLDWKMPGMDGVETARRIREKVGTQIPIIILTAYDWSEIETQAREAGVDAFLSKPVYKSKLSWKMTEIVTGRTDSREKPDMIFAAALPSGKHVLLAEDNELNKEIAVELLRSMGVTADCTEDGEAAVRQFASSEPGTYDMILMDIQMPRINGYEAAKSIRGMNRPDSRTIPIVAMTADAFTKDVQAAYAAGMDEHLAKPISVEKLRRVLIRFLTNSPEDVRSREEAGHEAL